MNNRFQIGRLYHIIGSTGDFSIIDKKVLVVAITSTIDAEKLGIDVYDKVYKQYKIPDEVYTKYLKDNPLLYHCKEVTGNSADSITKSSKDFYFSEFMVNLTHITELIMCKSYIWEIKSAPFVDFKQFGSIYPKDEYFEKIASSEDFPKIVSESISHKLPSCLVGWKKEETQIVSKSEYDNIYKSRIKNHEEASSKLTVEQLKENVEKIELIEAIKRYNKEANELSRQRREEVLAANETIEKLKNERNNEKNKNNLFTTQLDKLWNKGKNKTIKDIFSNLDRMHNWFASNAELPK